MRKIFALLLLLGSVCVNAQTVPTVNFTFSADPVTNSVVFTNTSITLGDGIKKAFWTFGDGITQVTGPFDGITHHYAIAGAYQACLKIYKYTNTNDSILLGSECKSITLQQTCTASFLFRDSVRTNPLTHFVSFLGGGSSNGNKIITQICWNFGDGHDTCFAATAGTSITSFLNIKHEYHQNGAFNVCLKIKYDGGCIAEKCNVVNLGAPTVTDSCAANFTIQPITATPLGRKFIAQPWHSRNLKPVQVCWKFGDGKDTCIQYTTSYTGDYWVEHRYAQTGSYEVCVTIKYDGGCEKKKCNTGLIISVPPVTDTCYFELNEASQTISGLERKFYVGLMSNRRAEKICWNFGDGTDTCVILGNPMDPQQLMITHHYPAPGNYTVCAKVYYVGGCSTQRCRQVSITVPQNNICGGYMTDSVISVNTIHFKGTGVQNGNDFVTSYAWTFGDGTTGSGQVINHTYASPGHYNVCLLLHTNLGCETKICKSVGVQGNNQPQLILSPTSVSTSLTAIFNSLYQQSVTVKIYNANGIMVKSYVRNAVVGVNNWTFTDVSTLPTGVYSVIVQSANQFATAIFFKQ